MGFDGISRYMINLDDKKHLIQEILDLLDIDIEWNINKFNKNYNILKSISYFIYTPCKKAYLTNILMKWRLWYCSK